jgi:hypothetical protein
LVGFLERPRKLLPVLAGAIPNAPDRLGRYPNILASKKDRTGLATCLARDTRCSNLAADPVSLFRWPLDRW